VRLLALLLLLAAPAAFAEPYAGPGVETCRAYAQADLKRYGESGTVRFVADESLEIDKYTRKAGRQFVSSVLTGHGRIADPKGKALEQAFVCLLADDKHAVFFWWLPR